MSVALRQTNHISDWETFVDSSKFGLTKLSTMQVRRLLNTFPASDSLMDAVLSSLSLPRLVTCFGMGARNASCTAIDGRDS